MLPHPLTHKPGKLKPEKSQIDRAELLSALDAGVEEREYTKEL